jgi:DNA-binding GntR family transcriptional regulator
MLSVKSLDGAPLYRQVQAGIEEMIRANPRAKEMPLSDAQLAERFGVSRITVRRAVDELDHGEMEIEARRADQRQAKALALQKGEPILVRRMTFLTKNNEPVLTGTSIYRADRVSYRLTLSS